MIRNYIRKFMQGRYGFDKLSFALTLLGFAISIVLSVVRIFFIGAMRNHVEVYYIFLGLSYLSYVPYAVAIFRALSRDFDKRRREEAAFMSVAGKWMGFFTKKINQKKDTEHRYFDCPTCHRTLRVPKGRGKIKIDCPHCGRQFTKRT